MRREPNPDLGRLGAMTNRRPFLASAICLVVVVAACSGAGSGGGGATEPGADGTGPAGGAPTLADLEGRTFLSTAAEGHDLVPGSQVRLVFTADGLSASAGCNTMGGAFTLEDGRLTTDALAMTEMACEEPLMTQDAWLAGLLADATLDLAGDTLILAAGDVRLILGDKEAVVPDLTLEGHTWLLDTIITGDAASSVPAGLEPTLLFVDGQLAITTGCNRGSGQVEIRDASIVLGPVMSTKMACDETNGALEGTIFGLLEGEVPYAIDGDRLTLGAGPTQLVYRATD